MTIMLLEWAVTSAFLILVVLALRAALGKRISAGLRYALWAVVLVRLLVPVQLFTSPLAGTRVFTTKTTEQVVHVPEAPRVSAVPAGEAIGLPAADVTPGGVVPAPPSLPDAPEPPAAPDLTKAPAWLGWIWLAGSGLAALVLLLSNLRFYGRLRRERIPLEGADCPLPVYVAVGLPSPCLFGVLRPTVYVTPQAAADPAMLRHALAHEYTHFRQGDHVWSLLRCAALAVHWWNPLVWLAAGLSRRDGELACDEGALKRLGDGERAAYGHTLLALVTAKPGPGDLFRCATTMAGDKKSLKERITRIARAPKRWLWAAVAVVLATALACVCAFGQAAEKEPAESGSPSALDSIEADLSLTLDENGNVDIGGTVDGLTLEHGAYWQPSGSPAKTLTMRYPSFADGIEGFILARWEDDSRQAVVVNTQMMAALSSYAPTGYWVFTVDWSGEEAVVSQMTAQTGTYPEGTEVRMYPESISDAEAVRAARVAAKLLTAAEDYYNNMHAGLAPWPYGVDEMTYVRDKGGFGGDFVITLRQNGSAACCEGPLSSYLGKWTWTQKGDTICLEDHGLEEPKVYYFKLDGGDLVFQAEDSGQFTYLRDEVADGDRFSMGASAGAGGAAPEVEIAFLHTGENPVSSYYVPEDVLDAAKADVAAKFQEYAPGGVCAQCGMAYNEETGWEPVPLNDPVEFDRVRIDDMRGPWSNTVLGMDIEVWRINYEFHTTTPEAAELLLVGGNYLTEDGWLCPTYSGCTYEIFTLDQEGGRSFTVSLMFNSGSPEDGAELFWENVAQTLRNTRQVDITRLAPDLNCNGVPEELRLSEMDEGMGQRLEVWEDGRLLYEEEGYFAHAGYNALFLYQDENGDYLLRYNPYMAQGWCTYSYKLFTLENGAETVVKEDSLEFDLNFDQAGHRDFDVNGIFDFVKDVNGLLGQSVQLLNTDADLLDTFDRLGRLEDDLGWLDWFEPVYTRKTQGYWALPNELWAFKAAMEAEAAPASDPYLGVIRGDEPLYSPEHGEWMKLDEFCAKVGPGSTATEIRDFAVLDLDGDGAREVVLNTDAGGYRQWCVVLHQQDGEMRGYALYIRWLNTYTLKEDGAFSWSSSAFENGWGKLRFTADGYETERTIWHTDTAYYLGDRAVPQAEYDAADGEQEAAPDAVWYDYTPENIRAVFS